MKVLPVAERQIRLVISLDFLEIDTEIFARLTGVYVGQ